MRMATVDEIIDMATTDPAFRQDLLADPRRALLERGVDLEPDQIQALESLAHEDLGVVSDELNERLAKVSEVERSY